MKLEQLAHINKNELSMIEVAHAILETQGNVIDFTELLVAIQEYLGFAESEFESRLSRFYTDINIDGRFISLGDNRWGLRAWYAIDEIDEEIITSAEEDEQPKRKLKKKRKLNAFADSDDMIDYNDDDPEDIDGIYDEEDETFEEEDEDEDEDDTASLTTIIDPDAEEEEDEDKELVAYKSDLTELGDEEIELDDDEDIEIDDEEVEDDEEEEEEEI